MMSYPQSRPAASPTSAKPPALAISASRTVLSTSAIARIAAVSATLLALFLIGQAATRATESLAIGIIAADLVFLIAIAGWSAVAVTKTGR